MTIFENTDDPLNHFTFFAHDVQRIQYQPTNKFVAIYSDRIHATTPIVTKTFNTDQETIDFYNESIAKVVAARNASTPFPLNGTFTVGS